MKPLTELKNKLKQFNLTLEQEKIYIQSIEGKRNTIFERQNKVYFDKDSSVWKTAVKELHGKRSSCYSASINYYTKIDRDLQAEADYEGEREWYGNEVGYAEIVLTSLKTNKKTKIQIIPYV